MELLKTAKLLLHGHEWTHVDASSPHLYAEKCVICGRTREDFLSGPFNSWSITDVGDRVRLLASLRIPLGIICIALTVLGSIIGYVTFNYVPVSYQWLIVCAFFMVVITVSFFLVQSGLSDDEITQSRCTRSTWTHR